MHTIASAPARPLQPETPSSSEAPHATGMSQSQLPQNRSLPARAATATEGRRLYKDHFPCPIAETAQISGSAMAFHLPDQAPLDAAQGSLHFRLLGNSQCATWRS